MTFVLEQGDAFPRSIQSDATISHRVGRVRRIELRTVCKAIAQLGAEDAQEFLVDS